MATAWSTFRSTRNLATALLALALLLFDCVGVFCTERFQRLFDRSSGLPPSEIFSFSQDGTGFFWIGTSGGLYRFDGTNARAWAPSVLTGYIRSIGPDVDGRMLVIRNADQTLYRINDDGVAAIIGPEGSPFGGVVDVAQIGKRLWVARQTAIVYTDDNQHWINFSSPLVIEQIRRFSPGLTGDLLVSTRGGLWQIASTLQASKLVASPHVNGAIEHPEDYLYYVEKLATGGRILQLHHGQTTEIAFVEANFNNFVLRGRTVWAAFDRRVVAIKPNEPPVVLGPNDGFQGGVVVVDNEGSLWDQSRDSLAEFPEPDTVLWNEKDGLPMSASISLLRTNEGLWVSTWAGLGRMVSGKNAAAQIINERIAHNSKLCVDGQGQLWAQADWHYFFHRENGRFIRHDEPDSGGMSDCATSQDGSVWLATSQGLFRASGKESPQPVTGPFGASVAIDRVLEAHGELWVTSDNKICRATTAGVVANKNASWSCNALEGVSAIGDLLEVGQGVFWAVSPNAVWRYSAGEWKPIAASRNTELKELSGLAPSLSGGVWVLGRDLPFRVIDRPGLSEGWQVVEQLSVWQGLPATASTDILEEADRGLWISTPQGVVHLSAEARETQRRPPQIKSVAASVNGRSVELQSPLQLPYGANQIELQFVALSFRDPALIRYQYRLRQTDSWTDSGNRAPVFRFFDLRPGKYAAQVRASLDGQNWSAIPAEIDFQVLGPWYLRWWAFVLFGSAILTIVLVAHRTRVMMLVGLERQRMRIARDLHDEIGSGLGSIGILSTVAHELEDTKRQELTREIAATASELGASLSDIVWSLRTDFGTLEDLAYYLRQRGNRMFPNGSQSLVTDFPQVWPKVNLSLAVRRNLLLIAVEALHNSARHSGSREVILGLAPSGNGWRMWIADNGRGIRQDTNGETSHGLGMQNMQLRAREIGTQISISSTNAGTVVSVVFSPRAK